MSQAKGTASAKALGREDPGELVTGQISGGERAAEGEVRDITRGDCETFIFTQNELEPRAEDRRHVISLGCL